MPDSEPGTGAIPVVMRLVNTSDPFTRIAAVWLDRLPPPEWTRTLELQNTAFFKKFITNGGDTTLQFTISVKDGKHKLYLAVSQNETSGIGVWSGTSSIGGLVKPFDRVDFDTIAVFEFTVKNGKVMDSTKPATDAETPNPGILVSVKDAFASFGTRLKSIEYANELRKQKVPIIIGSASIGAIAGIVIWQTKRRRF